MPDAPAPPLLAEGSETSASGVVWQRVAIGRGDRPGPDDAVRVHYTGWDGEGHAFAHTRGRGRAATFRVRELIPGLEEQVLQMQVGERRTVRVPSALAYGGHPGQPRGDLSFDLELLAVYRAPAAPSDVAAPPTGARISNTGLIWKSLAAGGAGPLPGPDDTVRIHASTWSTAGQLLDSTALRDHPLTIGVSRTMPGMAEALQEMRPGERRRLWIPEPLAYAGRPGAPAGMLVVDLELLGLVQQPAAPPAEPGEGAEQGASGLASRVLRPGTGARHPGPDSLVTLHYTGWTAAGELFDSSLGRGQPSSVRLRDVLPGWQEGLQLMVEGEQRRLWVPAALAFADKPDQPQGPMIYDLELLAITD